VTRQMDAPVEVESSRDTLSTVAGGNGGTSTPATTARCPLCNRALDLHQTDDGPYFECSEWDGGCTYTWLILPANGWRFQEYRMIRPVPPPVMGVAA